MTVLTPGVSIDIPVGTAFQYRCNGAEALRFLCITMPPWRATRRRPRSRSVGADSASRPGVFRDRILRQISVAGSEPAIARRSLEGSQAPSHAVKGTRTPPAWNEARAAQHASRASTGSRALVRAPSDEPARYARPGTIHRATAARRTHRSRPATRSRPDVVHRARERTPCADPPRRVKKHNRVRALEPLDECDVVVAVDDPLLPREQFALLLLDSSSGVGTHPGFQKWTSRWMTGSPSSPTAPANGPKAAPAMPVTTTRRPTKNAGAIHVAERSLSISRCSQARPGASATAPGR